MTEGEWNACADPQKMLEFLRGKVSDRKLRLFAVACCRAAMHWDTDKRCAKAVGVAEQYADGKASDEELKAAANHASLAVEASKHLYSVLESNRACLGTVSPANCPIVVWIQVSDDAANAPAYSCLGPRR